METELLVNADHVAKRLGVSRWKVLELARAGSIPVLRLGHKTVRFSPAEIDAWLEQRAVRREVKQAQSNRRNRVKKAARK